jgi:type II secretory pathway pseudopilin PulG
LIELVAVMVIVAILAAAAVPSLDAMADTRGAMTAKQLVRDLTYARQRALASGSVTWVVFDAAADTWSVLAEDPAAPGRTGATVLTDAASGRSLVQQLNAGSFIGVSIVSVDIDGDAEIGFDWLGAPRNAAEADLAAAGTITLTGNHAVTIAQTTGHVTYAAP